MSEKQNIGYSAVDLFKMICAVLVMLIHTKPFASIFWIDAGIGMITRFAVPFFFTIAGYFLIKKVNNRISTDEKWKIIKQYVGRLLRFYFIWFIIVRTSDGIISGHFYGIKYYIKQFIFTTDGSPLWFLNALIWATIIYAGASRWLKNKSILCIGILLLIVGYCLSTLYSITGDWTIVKNLRNAIGFIGIQSGVFFAFPYVSLGAFLADAEIIKNTKRYFLMTLFFFGCLGVESLIAVIILNAPFTFLWISAFPMTYYVVQLILTIKIPERPEYFKIRKISTLFYVLHIIVFKSLQKVFLVSGFNLIDNLNIVLTTGTLVITGCCALIILYLTEVEGLSWLKYLM